MNKYYWFNRSSWFIQVFIKSELKVGVLYVKERQCTEEAILGNNEHSANFEEFLTILGDKVRLKGDIYLVWNFERLKTDFGTSTFVRKSDLTLV